MKCFFDTNSAKRFAFILSLALALLSPSLLAADNAAENELVDEPSYNPWHFRVGPMMAPRVRVRVSSPRVVLPSLPKNGSSTSGTYGNAPASPSAGYTERRYTDGYVKPDQGTDDPDTMISGLTWDWGADNVPAQYSNGRVAFHTDAGRWTENYSSASFSEGSGSESDREVMLGLEAMGGWTFFDNATFDAAVDAGFRYYGSGDLSAASRQGASVSTTRNVYRIVDTYDASGWSSVPAGSHTGTPGGPGRLLGALPERGEELVGSESYTSQSSYRSYSNTRLDYDIWDLRLGPTAGWHATDWLTIRGGTYGLIGLVDTRLRTSTVGSAGSYAAKTSSCDPVFGMAFAISAQVNVTDNLFVMGSAEYDWWTDKVRTSAGGADARLELSDFTVSVCVGIEF